MRRKYQEIYEKYTNGEMDKKIDELKQKVEDKTANKEEYKELTNIEKVKQNVNKVENIMKFQEKIDAEVKKLNIKIILLEQEQKVENELNTEAEKLEDELKELEEKRVNLTAKLKEKNTSEEEKTLQDELNEVNSKIASNNKKFQKNLKSRLEMENVKKDDKNNVSLEELKEERNEYQNKSAKCDLIIINLLKGKKWDEIEVSLDKYKDRKFESSEKLSERKTKNNKEDKNKTTQTKEGETSSKEEELSEADLEKIEESLTKKADEIKSEETAIAEKSKFSKRFPMLAKIGNWFKTAYNKITNKDKYVKIDAEEKEPENKSESKPEVIKNNKQEEKAVNEMMKSDKESFKQYLKDIAEKGYDETVKDTTEKINERQLNKLKAAKEQAYRNESAKFGEEYAKKSYTLDEEQERD